MKLTKAEIRTEIKEIKSWVDNDLTQHVNTIITNEVYDDLIDEFVPLNKSARILAIQAMHDSEYLLRRLTQLSNKLDQSHTLTDIPPVDCPASTAWRD